MKNPMQPVFDDNGTARFKSNKIVRLLLDLGGYDMNDIAVLDFSDDDRMQFAQLIGYSVHGYHELSYVSDESAAEASRLARAINPEAGGCRDHGCEIHTRGD